MKELSYDGGRVLTSKVNVPLKLYTQGMRITDITNPNN